MATDLKNHYHNEFRHHAINGLCGIRAMETKLRDGHKYIQAEGEYKKEPLTQADITECLNGIDEELKRVFAAIEDLEKFI